MAILMEYYCPACGSPMNDGICPNCGTHNAPAPFQNAGPGTDGDAYEEAYYTVGGKHSYDGSDPYDGFGTGEDMQQAAGSRKRTGVILAVAAAALVLTGLIVIALLFFGNRNTIKLPEGLRPYKPVVAAYQKVLNKRGQVTPDPENKLLNPQLITDIRNADDPKKYAVYYDHADLNGDGQDEFFIAAGDAADTIRVYDIYTVKNKAPQPLFDRPSADNVTTFYLYADKTFARRDTARAQQFDELIYYSLRGTAREPQTVSGWRQTENGCHRFVPDENGYERKTEVSKQDFADEIERATTERLLYTWEYDSFLLNADLNETSPGAPTTTSPAAENTTAGATVQEADSRTVYAAVIAAYKTALGGDAADATYVNENVLNALDSVRPAYAFADIDGDGQEECVIGAAVPEEDDRIYDVFSFDGTAIIPLTDVGSIGYRSAIYIYADSLYAYVGGGLNGGAVVGRVGACRLEPITRYAFHNGESVTRTNPDGSGATEMTWAQYEEEINKVFAKGKYSFRWNYFNAGSAAETPAEDNGAAAAEAANFVKLYYTDHGRYVWYGMQQGESVSFASLSQRELLTKYMFSMPMIYYGLFSAADTDFQSAGGYVPAAFQARRSELTDCSLLRLDANWVAQEYRSLFGRELDMSDAYLNTKTMQAYCFEDGWMYLVRFPVGDGCPIANPTFTAISYDDGKMLITVTDNNEFNAAYRYEFLVSGSGSNWQIHNVLRVN